MNPQFNPNTTINSIVTLVNNLTTNAGKVGLAIAGLALVFYFIKILLFTDSTPAGRSQRWEDVRTAFIVCFGIGVSGVLIQFFAGLGGLVK